MHETMFVNGMWSFGPFMMLIIAVPLYFLAFSQRNYWTLTSG